MPIDVGRPAVLFQGRASANQTIVSANTWTSILLGVEDFDDANGHSTTENTSRYVVPRAGPYNLDATSIWNSGGTTGTARGIRIVRNGNVVPGSVGNDIYSGSFLSISTATLTATLAAGDVIEAQVYTSTANMTLYADGALASSLRVELVA